LELLRRGQAAKELLENPLLSETLGNLRADLLGQIASASLSDKDSHTRLVMAVQMSGAIERHLKKMINEGGIAAEAIAIRGKRID
jgi:hypothetical protein